MNYNITTSLHYFNRYIKKFFRKEVHSWISVIRFYRLAALMILITIVALLIFFKPLPPKKSYLAVGSEGSSYQRISNSFKKTFQSYGIDLELSSTNGLGEGLKKLNNHQSLIDASFLPAGIFTGKDFPELVSLGSIQYAPLWIFYRGQTINVNDPFEHLSNKKVSIGPNGSVTNLLYRELYRLNQDRGLNVTSTFELPPNEAAKKLIDGELDAVFIVDSINSETVRTLISDQKIKIMNFPTADAYLKNLDFLSKLIIPKGSLNIKDTWPEQDITILSSNSMLLVEKDTHPAVQWAYLLAAKEAESNTNSFFSSPGFFPRKMNVDFPLSPIANRFYENGIPVIFNYLPLSLASALEGTWVYLIMFIFLVLPMYKFLTKVRSFPMNDLTSKMFVNLRELDEDLKKLHSKDEILLIIRAIDRYEADLYSNWLYDDKARVFFNLKNSLGSVKRDANAKLQEFNQ